MFYTGTCSWAEKTLLACGEFYPKEVKTAEGRLRFYADRFSTVEVDSSYYAIPAKKTTELWSERTPEKFIFHIKVYGALTGHGVDFKTLPSEVAGKIGQKSRSGPFVYIKDKGMLSTLGEILADSIRPLTESGKLGLLIYQFPPWFRYSKENLSFILFCKKISGSLSVAAEFRHGSWLTPDRREEIFSFLSENEITYITADEPQYDNFATIPFIPHITTDTAYFRLHGRNKTNWLKKGITTHLRYSYLYSDDELDSFVPVIKEYLKFKRKVFVMFNNCHGGFAVKNALALLEKCENI